MRLKGEKLKILLISPLPPPAGGIATWTKLFINSEIAKEHNVDLINSAIKGKRINKLEKKFIVDEIKRVASIYLKVRKFLKDDYDIVHINCAGSTLGMIRDYVCAKKAKKTTAKVVFHFHCDTKFMIKGKFPEFIFRKICHKADQILCLNQSSQEYIKYKTTKESIKIPNFIDFDNRKFIREEISSQITNIIFVGHVMKSKGCADIISIAEKLPDINFKLIGKVAEEFKMLPKLKNIQYCGEISKEEVLNNMQSADLLLFPTYTEGFPNVVLEAMACGLPIITTPVGAIPEMLEDKGGVLVDVGDINGYITAINTLQEKKLRISMSLWNQEKVFKSYTTKIAMETIFSEYAKISRNQINNYYKEQPMNLKI